MMSLREYMEENRRVESLGCITCGRCLKVVPHPQDSRQQKQRLCDGCFGFDEQRREEQKNSVPGCQSSSEEFENSEVCNPDPVGFVRITGPRMLGLRSDARWYKKAGGNGDG